MNTIEREMGGASDLKVHDPLLVCAKAGPSDHKKTMVKRAVRLERKAEILLGLLAKNAGNWQGSCDAAYLEDMNELEGAAREIHRACSLTRHQLLGDSWEEADPGVLDCIDSKLKEVEDMLAGIVTGHEPDGV